MYAVSDRLSLRVRHGHRDIERLLARDLGLLQLLQGDIRLGELAIPFRHTNLVVGLAAQLDAALELFERLGQAAELPVCLAKIAPGDAFGMWGADGNRNLKSGVVLLQRDRDIAKLVVDRADIDFYERKAVAVANLLHHPRAALKRLGRPAQIALIGEHDAQVIVGTGDLTDVARSLGVGQR